MAVALVGISIGVILSGFALGHRQARRGMLANEAAQLAEGLLHDISTEEIPLEEGGGNFEDHPGWSYKIAIKEEIQPDISSVDGQGMGLGTIEDPDLQEVTITILPPGKKPRFRLIFITRNMR